MNKETAAQLQNTLHRLAAEAGLPAVGVASAEDFRELENSLNQLKKAGRYPLFVPVDTTKRCRPSRNLPGVRTLIAAALPYLVAPTPKETPSRGAAPEGSCAPATPRASASASAAVTATAIGDISVYACRPDYHEVLLRRLNRLATLLRDHFGPRYRFAAFTDTGPLVDRAVAARAGLGRFGKNGCLYVEPWGSYVFLGYILTNLPFLEAGTEEPASSQSMTGAPATPSAALALDACAECDLCVRACPTGAIEKPFTVNPRLCLSEVTQKSGYIPRELRKLVGRRLFGCDACQRACPLNRRASRPEDAELAAFPDSSAGAEHPELPPLLTPNRQDSAASSRRHFAATWGRSPAGWKGPNVLARNAAVVLGNLRSAAAVPALVEALLSHQSPVVRAHAAWALGQTLLGRPDKPVLQPAKEQIRCALAEASRAETDPNVLEELRMPT